jgi:hypothetical protein
MSMEAIKQQGHNEKGTLPESNDAAQLAEYREKVIAAINAGKDATLPTLTEVVMDNSESELGHRTSEGAEFTEVALDVIPTEKKDGLWPAQRKALLQSFPRKVELTPDGKHIMLQREDGDPFSIRIENVNRIIAAEGLKKRYRQEDFRQKHVDVPKRESNISDSHASNGDEQGTFSRINTNQNSEPEVQRVSEFQDTVPISQDEVSGENHQEAGHGEEKPTHEERAWLNREAANEEFPVPGDSVVTEDFEPLSPDDIKQIERLRNESAKLNFSADTIRMLERAGYVLVDSNPVFRDGKYYINVTHGGVPAAFSNSQAITHLKELAKRSKEVMNELKKGAVSGTVEGSTPQPSVDSPILTEKLRGKREKNEKELFWESEVIGTNVDDVYREAAELHDENASEVNQNADTKPKHKLTPEEQQQYLTSLKEKRDREHASQSEPPVPPDVPSGGGGETPPPKKPHLDNEASRAYLKEVQEMRERQQNGMEQFHPEVGSPVPEVDQAVDIEPPTTTGVDIELPLNEPRPPTTPPSALSPSPETPKRSYDDINKEISYLEKIKSEVSYTSKEFRDRYKLNEKFPRGHDAAAIMWIEKKLSELKSEATESAIDAKGFFDDRFERQFGITKQELEKLPGWQKLSNGQQMLVYENLRDYHDAEARGHAQAMWDTAKELMGAKVETKLKKGDKGKGIEPYQDFLTKLVYATAEYGPRVHVENGETRVDFIGMEYDREHRPRQKAACDALNAAAHAFAQIPESAGESARGLQAETESGVSRFFREKILGSKSKDNVTAFAEARTLYEEAQRNFAKELEATGVSKTAIAEALVNVDSKVYQTRFIASNPDVAELIQTIPDKKFWREVGKKTLFFGSLGAIGRTLTGGALGVLSGPAVAASIGGTRSWNESAALQRERDRKARLGTVDGSAGALNIIPATNIVKTSEGEMNMGITAKLERLAMKFLELPPESKDDSEETRTKRERMRNELKQRATYAQDKFNLNRIQFGDKESYALNHARFSEVLGLVQVALASEGMLPYEETYTATNRNERGEALPDPRRETLAYRAQRFLDHRETSMVGSRKKEAIRKATLGATIAGGMAAGGAYAMHEFLETDVGQRFVERVKTGAERVGSWITGGDTSSPGKPGIPAGERGDLVMPEAKNVVPPPAPPESPTIGQEGSEGGEARAFPIRGEGFYDANEQPNATLKEAEKNLLKGETLDRVPSPVDSSEREEILKMFEEKKPEPVPSGSRNSVPDVSSMSPSERARYADWVASMTVEERAELAKQGGAPRVYPTEAPRGPTSAERAEIRELFGSPRVTPEEYAANVKERDAFMKKWLEEGRMLNEAENKIIRSGRALEAYFVNTHVHARDWARVRYMPVNEFMDRAYDPLAKNRLPQSLINLSRVFAEASPRFGLEPIQGEPTEKFMQRVFYEIERARARGEDVRNMQGYLTNIKKDWFPRRR